MGHLETLTAFFSFGNDTETPIQDLIDRKQEREFIEIDVHTLFTLLKGNEAQVAGKTWAQMPSDR